MDRTYGPWPGMRASIRQKEFELRVGRGKLVYELEHDAARMNVHHAWRGTLPTPPRGRVRCLTLEHQERERGRELGVGSDLDGQ